MKTKGRIKSKKRSYKKNKEYKISFIKLQEVCPNCGKIEFFIDHNKNNERRCRLCFTHWDELK